MDGRLHVIVVRMLCLYVLHSLPRIGKPISYCPQYYPYTLCDGCQHKDHIATLAARLAPETTAATASTYVAIARDALGATCCKCVAHVEALPDALSERGARVVPRILRHGVIAIRSGTSSTIHGSNLDASGLRASECLRTELGLAPQEYAAWVGTATRTLSAHSQRTRTKGTRGFFPTLCPDTESRQGRGRPFSLVLALAVLFIAGRLGPSERTNAVIVQDKQWQRGGACKKRVACSWFGWSAPSRFRDRRGQKPNYDGCILPRASAERITAAKAQ